MTLVYATPADYETWTAEAAPANITQLLRSASIRMAEWTKQAYYDADPTTGAPIDTTIAGAFRDATCAQTAVWVKLGIDPDLLGLDSPLPKRAKRLGQASVDYDTTLVTSQAAFAMRQAAATQMCEEAASILRGVGVLKSRVWTYG